VNNDGVWWEIGTSGAITTGAGGWNWDGNDDLSSRFWVLIWVPSGLWQDDGTFADEGLIEDGGTIGSTALPDVVAGVQYIIRDQSCENSRHMHTILIFNSAEWDANQPNGTWGTMSNRNVWAEYWPGDVVV
jgi:hypothetical protein